MALIAQTFAPFKSKAGRYETAVTYQNLNQIGAPAVKRVVADNNSRIIPIYNRKLDVEPWEPYFYSTQLGLVVRKITLTDPSLRIIPIYNRKLDIEPWEPYFYSTKIGLDTRKITITDPSLRMVPFKNVRFDNNNEPYANINKIGAPPVKRVVADNNSRIISHRNIKFDNNNEPYANINKIGAPPVKRVVADNNSRILPLKRIEFDVISYISYNWYYDLVRTGIGTKPSSAGTTGIDGTSQRATKHKNIPYHVISYMSYNYWNDINKTGLSVIGPNNASYIKNVTGVGGSAVDGTTQAPVNVSDSTNFSISDSPYPDIVKEGITLYKITIDGNQSSVTYSNIRYDQSINYIYNDPPYRIGLPTTFGTIVANDSRSIPITVSKFHNQPLEGPYYVMTRVGLQMGNITGISIATNYQFWS